MRAHFLLLICVVMLCSCNETQPEQNEAEAVSTITSPPGKNWISVAYADCMSGQCPCECLHDSYHTTNKPQDDVTMILIDSLNGRLHASVYTHNSDCDSWYLIQTTQTVFQGVRSDPRREATGKQGEQTGVISISPDTLELRWNETITKFIHYPGFEIFAGQEFIGRINAHLLQNSINPTDTLIRSLLAVDSTTLTCSPEMGNLIHVPGFTHDKWILIPHGDSVWLYQHLGDGNKQHDIPKADTVCVGKFPRN